MAMTYTSVVPSLLILILSASLAIDAIQPLNSKQLKDFCDKTPHPAYCFDIMDARYIGPITYGIATPAEMAQYLMSIAAGIGHELTALARAELHNGGGAAQRRCMKKCATGFGAAAKKLDVVDGALLENSLEIFEPVYRYVVSKAPVLAQDWNACPVKPTAGGMASKQKHFAMLLEIIIALGKLPDPK